MRLILHVDLDAFYASVEELDHPEWAGHPLVVGGDPQEGRGRGVVTTANYAARKFGIRSAMPIGEAWRRCPDARFVRPRFERYAALSREVFALVHEGADAHEQSGIDEGYLEVTNAARDFAGAVGHARALQARIRERTGLTASFGVASNKLVAKIATDLQKPYGLTPVPPGTEAEFLAPLPARKIPGVGPKTEARLVELGILTCGALASAAPSLLQREFGTFGPRLSQMARGVDDAPVDPGWQRKSMGSETTFSKDTEDQAEWARTIASLAEDLGRGLRQEGLRARTVTLKVRLTGFETHTHARTLPHATAETEDLVAAALGLLRENPPPRAVRLLGVRVTGLLPKEGDDVQRRLSDWPADLLGEAGPWRPRQRSLGEYDPPADP